MAALYVDMSVLLGGHGWDRLLPSKMLLWHPVCRLILTQQIVLWWPKKSNDPPSSPELPLSFQPWKKLGSSDPGSRGTFLDINKLRKILSHLTLFSLNYFVNDVTHSSSSSNRPLIASLAPFLYLFLTMSSKYNLFRTWNWHF